MPLVMLNMVLVSNGGREENRGLVLVQHQHVVDSPLVAFGIDKYTRAEGME